jgi:hypothetical protein
VKVFAASLEELAVSVPNFPSINDCAQCIGSDVWASGVEHRSYVESMSGLAREGFPTLCERRPISKELLG